MGRRDNKQSQQMNYENIQITKTKNNNMINRKTHEQTQTLVDHKASATVNVQTYTPWQPKHTHTLCVYILHIIMHV